jgi:hypothetical protein
MKARPALETKKDPAPFLAAAEPAPSVAGLTAPQLVALVARHREQKIFRLPVDLAAALKKAAYERSVASGVRVTETELVEAALRAFLRS